MLKRHQQADANLKIKGCFISIRKKIDMKYILTFTIAVFLILTFGCKHTDSPNHQGGMWPRGQVEHLDRQTVKKVPLPYQKPLVIF